MQITLKASLTMLNACYSLPKKTTVEAKVWIKGAVHFKIILLFKMFKIVTLTNINNLIL